MSGAHGNTAGKNLEIALLKMKPLSRELFFAMLEKLHLPQTLFGFLLAFVRST
jgi:hypothetical protein